MKTHHVIIGAGISGLALGWYLKKRLDPTDTLTILEADHRAGGWIRSHRNEGFLFEEGARSCRTRGNGLATLKLVEELDLCNEVIHASPEAKKRYIYWEGKLQEIPSSFFSFLFSPLTKGVLPAMWKEWRIPPGDMEDESIQDFFVRRFEKKIAEKFIDPLVSGIYAGDIRKLSMRSCFPEMYATEQQYGSILKGMLKRKKRKEEVSTFVKEQSHTSIFSFKNGMETLVEALSKQLKDEIRLSCGVKSIQIENPNLEVLLENGQRLQADQVYLAVSAHSAARLLQQIDSRIANEAAQGTYATVASVNMGWNESLLKYHGFGYLVPSSQKQDILGVVFDSSALSGQNSLPHDTRLTVMLGGTHHSEIASLSDQEIIDKASKAIRSHLGIVKEPTAMRLNVARNAIPQYELGHEKRMRGIKNQLEQASNGRIQLLGCAWNGVSINDCIAESARY